MNNKDILLFNLIIAFMMTLDYICFCTAQHASVSLSTDQQALEAIKAQISFDPLGILTKNWSAKTSVCDWEGITCGFQSRTQRVIALDLSYMGLVGTISPHIGNLSFLSLLSLYNNSFHGSIPPEIAQLRRLEEVYIGGNNLTGILPLSYFNNMSKLEMLYLDRNNFTGTLSPYILDGMESLKTLYISHNSLHGNIPKELGNRSCLQNFSVANNQLTGFVPPTFFNQSCLRNIDLSVNGLSGRLPDVMCNDKLRLLYISLNEFTGPIPSSIIKCQQLGYLSMSYNKFSGSLPRVIGNMTLLKVLFLGYNDFKAGSIPGEIGNLKRLELLHISAGNLEGHIPQVIFNMSSLKVINLKSNRLSGVLFPDIYTSLHNLEELYISENWFSGPLPPGLWKLRKIRKLGLQANTFIGKVPSEVSNLSQITHLYLGINKLTGVIPDEINHLHYLEELSLGENMIGGNIRFNISALKKLDLSQNMFSGVLPADMGFWLPNLQELYLTSNIFRGTLPSSITNSSKLWMIELSNNSFSGSMPITIGRLELLERLLFGENNFTVEGSELNFLSSLTNCRKLRTLYFANNPMQAFLPTSIGNLSTSLEIFQASGCGIKGKIPSGIGNLTNLQLLGLDMNELKGNVPTTLGKLHNIGILYLNNNRLQGGIPQELCLLKNLEDLYLSKNQLSGTIPPCLGDISSLTWLLLDSNTLTSSIPSNLWTHKTLVVLNLSSNILTGNLLSSTQSSNSPLTTLDLSFNRLSGDIPSSISSYQILTKLSLSHNSLQGSIPESLGHLISLEFLELSQNKLSGVIPRSLETLRYLEYLNLSFNRLQGEIPSGGRFSNFTASSFMHNKDLCGAPKLEVLSCRSKQHESRTLSSLKYILPVIASIIGLVLAVYLFRRHGKSIRANVELPSPVEWTRVSYYELIRATESFDESNLIGKGAYGSVFKGKLSDGVNVAIKVFNLLSEDALKSFAIECEVLRNIRHRNLVRIISSCTNLDFRCLVMEYMSNGSLEQWLYSHNNHLSLVQRLQILIDVASALEYLHNDHPTPIIHCDLKPSNVLLDEDMHARVCDFGIAKIFGAEEFRIRTVTLGTIGYMAPEYGMEGIVSPGSDVYSFGILMLETFTRKKPTDEMFCGEVSLRSWVLEATHRSVFEVVDEDLINEHLYAKQASLASIFNLAMDCTSDSSSLRTNMKETVVMLRKIQKNFLANN
ncbi:hypothetical protein SSX86_027161 [Deinandra increscens subsp. villosa]|uniref:non-specific serine/threonine protein kinase n=1 Tax=Deinandra increscens subsp. villosa TaxID=3103831 RepID=A0AAP0CFU0_9ASTR